MFGLIAPIFAAGVGGHLIDNWLHERQEERDIDRASARASAVTGSLPPGATGDDWARGAFNAGLLSPAQYADSGFIDQRYSREAQDMMERQQVASGPGYMNADTTRERLIWEQQRAQAQDAAAQAAGQARDQYLNSVYGGVVNNELAPVELRTKLYEDTVNRQSQRLVDSAFPEAAKPSIGGFDSPTAAQGFVDTSNRVTSSLGAINDALAYMDENGRFGEAMSRDDRASLVQGLNLTSLPTVAQRIMSAGAMSDDERPFFQNMATGNVGDFERALISGDGKAGKLLLRLGEEMEKMQYADRQIIENSPYRGQNIGIQEPIQLMRPLAPSSVPGGMATDQAVTPINTGRSGSDQTMGLGDQ